MQQKGDSMTEEAKKRKYTEANKRATMNYYANRSRVSLTITKEQRQELEQRATTEGMSINQYIVNQLFK
jgi:predicted DNA binding CopG/RHH family protein